MVDWANMIGLGSGLGLFVSYASSDPRPQQRRIRSETLSHSVEESKLSKNEGTITSARHTANRCMLQHDRLKDARRIFAESLKGAPET